MYKTFLIRIIISIFLATLSLSPGFSMEERVDNSRPAMNLTLSAKQNEFVESLNNNLILKLRKRFEDMVVPFRVLTQENETEDPFYAYYRRVHPNVLKIQKHLKEEFPRLKTYYEENKDFIGTPIDVEAYLTSLQGELIKIFEAFSEESKKLIDPKSTAEKAKTKYLYSKIPEFEKRVLGVFNQFSIGEDRKSLEVHFFGEGHLDQESPAPGMKIQQGAAARAEDSLSEEQERLKKLETRLKPLTVRIESLIAPVKGGRDGDGYSIANEGIMRVGNLGGLTLLEDIRRLLPPLFAPRQVAYLEPREGAALGFSKEDAVMFYRSLVTAGHVDLSSSIIESFNDMLSSPAFNRAAVLRLAQEKSGRTFESLYANYNAAQTPENQNKLAEELLKLGVIEHHSTRLLHPLALVKSLWDQKPDLRPTLLESLPSYFTLMADQIGKCAAGATGRTIIMSRLLAEALIKTPIK